MRRVVENSFNIILVSSKFNIFCIFSFQNKNKLKIKYVVRTFFVFYNKKQF